MRRIFGLLLALSSVSALADPYDFQIYRLGNPQPGEADFNASANGNFRVFVRQLAAAVTSVNLMPPGTLGHAGFAISADLSVVNVPQAAEAPWPVRSATGFKTPLLLPSLHLRKGLPFSFELGARGGWVEQSRMFFGTAELKWALNEGFTYLPDISVRGAITKVFNTRDFDVTTGGVDLSIGKRFAIAGTVTLTPYAGWNLQFVGATSGNVDFKPDRPLATADAPTDLAKSLWVFRSVTAASNAHNRFYGGLRFIAGALQVGAEFSYSVMGSFRDVDTGAQRDIPSLWAASAQLGLDL